MTDINSSITVASMFLKEKVVVEVNCFNFATPFGDSIYSFELIADIMMIFALDQATALESFVQKTPLKNHLTCIHMMALQI